MDLELFREILEWKSADVPTISTAKEAAHCQKRLLMLAISPCPGLPKSREARLIGGAVQLLNCVQRVKMLGKNGRDVKGDEEQHESRLRKVKLRIEKYKSCYVTRLIDQKLVHGRNRFSPSMMTRGDYPIGLY